MSNLYEHLESIMTLRSTCIWLPAVTAFFLIVGVSGLLAACQGVASTPAILPEPTFSVNEPTDVVAASGVVVPLQEAVLSIRASGRLVEVLVAEGDQVTAGQTLARIDARDLEQALREAEAGLNSAQASLARVKAGAGAQEIASADAAVAIAQAGVKAAEAALKIAEGNLAAAQADEAAAQGAIEVVRGNIASAQAALNSAQAALNKLLAGPTSLEIQIAEAQLERARNELWAAQSQRDVARNLLEGQIAAYEQLVKIAELQLDQLKAGARAEDIAAARAQVAQAQAGVQVALGQEAQAEAQKLRAVAGVRIAEGQVAQAQAQVESARAQAAQAEAQRDQLRAGSRPEDIAIAEAAVAQAEAAVVARRNALADAVLVAPFSGTVGALLVETGELVSPQTPVLRLGDLSRLRVQTEDLGEADVNLVRVGQAARVTIDALPNLEFKGTVVRIAPYASDRRGDKVYEVLIDLELPPDAGLRWGMSTFVEIAIK